VVWDTRTGKRKGVIAVPEELPLDDNVPVGIAVSPDGRLLAATTGSFQVNDHPGEQGAGLWELASGQLRRQLGEGPPPKPMFGEPFGPPARIDVDPPGRPLVAFAPDNKTLAWNQGRSLGLWEVAGGQFLRRIGGLTHRLRGIAFSPAGDILATASSDGTASLWDPATGTLLGRVRSPRGGFSCLAFSPDGQTLYTGGEGSTILFWDVARVLARRRARVRQVSPLELKGLWERLAAPDAAEAGLAVGRLQAAPRQAVRMLRARLRPVAPVDQRRIARLITDLESNHFRDRRRATRELEQLAELAEPLLRRRLANHPPLETRQQVEKLLKRLDGFVTRPNQLRLLRAVEVLERIGTADARALLRDLAKGAPAARLTREAKSALQRLEHRPRG
jgi:hypothetical protein